MTDWVKRNNVWVAKEPTAPGIWKRRDGGYYLRVRAIDERTGKEKERNASLPEASLPEAREALDALRLELRTGGPQSTAYRPRFYEYATLLLERKITSGSIKSSETKTKWKNALTRHLIPFFGEFYVDKIRATDVEAWKLRISAATYTAASKRKPAVARNAKRNLPEAKAKTYGPASKNTWLTILRVILAAARDEFALSVDPMATVEDFDTSDHHTYTEEEPNALTPEEAARFLAKMRELFPQHYAMTALGFATGLRPSTLRPLRRRGPTPDVQWGTGVLLVRRSQTKGEAMKKTKTARDQRIHLPDALMALLDAHRAGLPSGPMQESELLFPSEKGGYRSKSVLDKPFAVVAKAIGLGKKFTQRGMRRTYQDLMRAAGVEGFVTRSISGHATETMQDHYSTAYPTEQRASITSLLALVGVHEGGMHSPAPSAGGKHDGMHDREMN